MSSDRGSKRVDTRPYRYAGESLEFDYVECTLGSGTTLSLGDTIELDLTDEDEEWETSELTVSISVSKSTLERVFPASPLTTVHWSSWDTARRTTTGSRA
ncbi:hypothetical protein ACFQS4_01350 [Saliphagus sp. GCM10025317]